MNDLLGDDPEGSRRLLALGVRSRELIETVGAKFAPESLEIITHQQTAASGWKKAELKHGSAIITVLDLPTLIERTRIPQADLILFSPHRDRELTNLWADAAVAMLEVGGRLILVGGKREGIEPLEKRMERSLERVSRATVKPLGRGSVWRKTAPSTVAPALSMSGFDALGRRFVTLPGMSHKSSFDAAAELLVKSVETLPGERVLDLGCGSGVVGISLMGRQPTLRVAFCDEDANALVSTRANVESAGLNIEGVFLSDGMEAFHDELFDVIALNPPFHSSPKIDMAIARRLVGQVKEHLTPSGRFYLVGSSHSPYEDVLTTLFDSVEQAASEGGFDVWVCH
jgi:16S rRNA (guanine1207-N2)-methyltransferase